jgi:hypothetical protein
VITGVCIKKRESFATRGGIDYLIDAGKGNGCLGQAFIETSVINTHSLFTVLLIYKYRIR